MALLTCPECRGAVSSTAASCPHCGYQPARTVQVNQSQAAVVKFFDPAANARSCLGVIAVVVIVVLGGILLSLIGAR